jgi:hypothetical protein
MPIRITLSDSETLSVNMDLDAWNAAFQQALQNDTMVEIEDQDGRIFSINPHRVLFLEAEPAESLA